MNSTIERPLLMREAAEALGVSTETLRQMVRRGEIRTTRVGCRPRVEVAELRRYIQAGRQSEAA
jgi:excisionase family DNA binding protein